MRLLKVQIEFVPNDLWIGIFWKNERCISSYSIITATIKIFICIIPMLPIVFTFTERR